MNTENCKSRACAEESVATPAIRFSERADGYDLTAEIPGAGKADVDLHVDGRTLTMRTKAAHQNPAGFRVAVREFEHRNYAVSLDLPELVDLSTIKGSVENGVLKVTMQKRAEVQPRRIEIA